MSASQKRVMFLTGCASGIGRHLSKILLDQGHRLYCTDIEIEAVNQWVEEGDYTSAQVATRKLDVRQPLEWKKAIDDAVKTFGDLDVVMNIAGYLRPGYIDKVVPADVDMHIDVNVKGVIFGTRAAAARMIEQGHGHIVNVGSLASLSCVPGMSLYCASKFAVRGFTLSVAEELRKHHVDTTVVLLDAVKTPMLDLQADYEEAALTFSGDRPLTLKDVEEVFVDDVLRKRRLEVVLPRGRGMMARFAGMAPEITRFLAPTLMRRGREAQEDYEPEQ